MGQLAHIHQMRYEMLSTTLILTVLNSVSLFERAFRWIRPCFAPSLLQMTEQEHLEKGGICSNVRFHVYFSSHDILFSGRGNAYRPSSLMLFQVKACSSDVILRPNLALDFSASQ